MSLDPDDFGSLSELFEEHLQFQSIINSIIELWLDMETTDYAASPASNEALRNLERQLVDQSMVSADDKVQCAICLEWMELGNLATTLPCKHIFHDNCVVTWLKERNTCPMCRRTIEKIPESVDGCIIAPSPIVHQAQERRQMSLRPSMQSIQHGFRTRTRRWTERDDLDGRSLGHGFIRWLLR